MNTHRVACSAALALVLLGLEAGARAQCPTWKPGFGSLGGGLDADVRTQVLFNDGSGTALYGAGSFTAIGGNGAQHVAKWNGTSWSALGTGVDNHAVRLAAFDDGAGIGPDLYVGGSW